MIFLKLGGSLITDKSGHEAVRMATLSRLAAEIAAARAAQPGLKLLLGHGSGSFGHVAAAKYGTRQGITADEGWHGLGEVAAAAGRLNAIVWQALLEAGVPAISFQPSASAVCREGRLQSLTWENIGRALDAGMLPVVYGDVALDTELGGTIISTEEIFGYLAPALHPRWLLLAGETEGVLDAAGQPVALIQPDSLSDLGAALGGSRGTDVTGGMLAKVQATLAMLESSPGLRARIFSGLEPGLVVRLLLAPETDAGTRLQAGPVG
ncbi:MAG: isopentenyl phosphate kinase [Candidatus Promineifilaceae bacterium]